MKNATMAASVLLACVATLTQAQTVYRCGNEYSQKPCAGGAAVAVEDERSAAQAKDGAAAARRDAKLGTAMEKERLAREKEQGGPASLVLGPPKAAPAPVAAASKPGQHAKKKKGKEPEHFSAVAPRPAAEKKKEKTGKKS